jgi:hypothetical protein
MAAIPILRRQIIINGFVTPTLVAASAFCFRRRDRLSLRRRWNART